MQKLQNDLKKYKYDHSNNYTNDSLKTIVNGHYEITEDPEDIELIRFMVGGMVGK
ncbi:hypothetical protein [Methanolobus sp. WCC4]|uniref:hypothetical protein n=1 Tax=Methanolobus sp. WCC4 TaxID=3125784 RepID=UPI0030F846AB